MDPVLRKYALEDVPRYTSYPTAVQFSDGFSEEIWQGWLARLSDVRSLSAYVHIPFCEQLCWYCGCHTSVPNSYDRATSYTDTLLKEITRTGSLTGGPKGRVDHFHFGGGTATYLNADDLERIVKTVDDAFGIAGEGELAIEIDPRTFSRNMANALVGMGFNRASFGVQDFNRVVQEKINRIQPFEQVAECMDDLRTAGIDRINFDLIYGLPGQTTQSVIETAHLTAKLRPSRIAVFGYAHVPWFAKHQRMIKDEDLPNIDERFDQTRAMTETLQSEGYVAIGLDHFVLPDDDMAAAAGNGTLRRNFQGYTTDASDALIGFGVSSISAFPEGFAQNARNTLTWSTAVNENRSPVNRGLVQTREDKFRGAIIERLMCDFTVDPVAIAAAHGFSNDSLISAYEALKGLQQDGLVVIEGSTITVPKDRRLFVRTVARAFDAYYTAAPNRHAKAV